MRELFENVLVFGGAFLVGGHVLTVLILLLVICGFMNGFIRLARK